MSAGAGEKAGADRGGRDPKALLARHLGTLRPRLEEVLRVLHGRPEVGGRELESAELLCSLLEEAGYRVQRGVAGLPTAFRAEAGQGSPAVGLIVEYDALPGLGHACGHDWSGLVSVGAALALAAVGLPRGRVVAVGTPDEEGTGGKIPMIGAGVFADLDAALMVHAFDGWHLQADSLALQEFDLLFLGKPAHAAAAPFEGVNALDAVMLTFAAVNCLRQHIRDGSRIHGIVTEGGQAVNVIPERAAARISVRATTTEYLDVLIEKVLNCARAGALATGCSLEIKETGPRYESMRTNRTLARMFADNLGAALRGPVAGDLGVERAELPPWEPEPAVQAPPVIGSTDMGNLSRVVPSIHPMAAVAPPGVKPHTPEFAAATVTSRGVAALLVCAWAVAATTLDLLSEPRLVESVRAEFAGA